MVKLKEITTDNLEDVLNLQVSVHQEKYVSSTAYSLAQAYVYRETAFPFAIYADNMLVGFIMFGFYESRNQYTLWKFLIDKQYQNKGYGREALKQGIAYLKERFGVNEIYVGVALENEQAKHLYSSVGFAETGMVEDNMEEMRYIC
ncbi:MAG: GNAT family N-acetyltransferase [Clostridia bacterium]|nr:GNAT family N-acetyltransferase [Clostridia bacterium]